MNQAYENAKQTYAAWGIDSDKAMETLAALPLSVHCWQGDDVRGFDTKSELSGGIQTTGNYPGRATTPEELMSDLNFAFSLIGGKKKLNLHASYAIFEEGEWADRDELKPAHFKKWVQYAKDKGIGLDFNPTFFGHPKAEGLTLTSPDEAIRSFWVRHGIACLRIAEYFATETGVPCVMNVWIPDGYKDIPADRYSPRERFAKSMDEILGSGYDRSKVSVTLESKVFGIGLESYTAGSSEFCLSYAMSRGLTPLLDNGHFHPTENVADKISTLLLFFPKIALHVTRSVRWDSDHVVRLDEESREIAKEIAASNRMQDISIALDYFDASINRVAAWVIGVRNLQKALLEGLLMPHQRWAAYQREGRFTELMMEQEEFKSLPAGEIWKQFCRSTGVPEDRSWFDAVKGYEEKVLALRNQ